MRRWIKKIAFPILNRWYQLKTKKKSTYTKHGISLQIHPNVFHPGVFLSTNIFIEYLSNKEVSGERILELGAGSGMISFYLAKKGAIVTATDINRNAINGITENQIKTGIPIKIIQSNLFDNITELKFNRIIINPPYYPKKANNEKEQAFYCGLNFEYFEQLFYQLSKRIDDEILMILSEDCNLEKIKEIALKNNLFFKLVHQVKKRAEENYIFTITKINEQTSSN